MNAKITITLKQGLLDAQGKTVKGALQSLGFESVEDVRVGKYIELKLSKGSNAAAAKAAAEKMCQQLLANPVIETYRIDVG